MKREMLGVAMCGGASARMGGDKASLVVREGVSQLDYTLSLLGQVCLRVAAAVGRTERALPPGVAAILDEPNATGPVAGVLAALRAAKGWPVLVVACDMPFVEISHLVQLVNRRDERKVASAFLAADGKPDPMCAVYEAGALPLLEAAVSRGCLSLRRFLAEQDVELIALADSEWLASVNDRGQLAAARERFA